MKLNCLLISLIFCLNGFHHIIDFNPENLTLARGSNNTFKIRLKNTGITTATNINSTLTTLNNFVWITQSTSGFDAIDPGQSEESLDEFHLTVLSSAPDLLFIPFTLTIQTNEGNFTEEFFLQVKASQLVYRGNKISSTNNDNIFAEPGEDVNFKVELLNIGSEDAEIVEAVIICDPPIL